MTQKDGFTNLVSAIGAANGKTGANTYVSLRLGQQDLDNAYRSSTWFGKIVDIPADDATREWRQWNADKAQIELLEAAEKRLNVRVKVNQALRWARLYGGAVIIPDLPGRPASAVNLDRVTASSVRFLHVLSRYEIRAEGIIRDPLSPNYGQPEYYEVNGDQGQTTRFHPSRVILINGRRPGTLDHSNQVWGDPIWHNLSDAVLASDSSAAVVAALMQEAKIDVVRVADLMSGLATQAYEDKLLRRWQLVAQLKSVANVTLIDKDDEWEQKSVTFGGIPDTVNALLTIMAGAADIPVTRLIGTSAGGLNATGEGDLRNYYDSIKAHQDLRISPMLAPLDEIIIRDALGTRPVEIWYDWRALWQPDQKTQAETQKLRAETYAIELNTGAIDEEALTKAYLNGAIESGLYPGLEAAMEESSNEGLATPEEQAQNQLEAEAEIAAQTQTQQETGQ